MRHVLYVGAGEDEGGFSRRKLPAALAARLCRDDRRRERAGKAAGRSRERIIHNL